MISVLMRNSKVARASHNMWAFRIRIPAKDTFLQDYDDDGEAAAGSRLLHLLQVLPERNLTSLLRARQDRSV